MFVCLVGFLEQPHSYTKSFTGIISIEAPHMVDYNTSVYISCKTSLVTPDDVKWYIKKDAITQSITNGTEATVHREYPWSMVHVTQTTEVWRGRLFPKE